MEASTTSSDPKKDSGPEQKVREIALNDPKANRGFVQNAVHTTKYTLTSFLFIFLMNELSRPANIFFVTIIIIQVNSTG